MIAPARTSRRSFASEKACARPSLSRIAPRSASRNFVGVFQFTYEVNNLVMVKVMPRTLKTLLFIGAATLTASLSAPATATPTALSVQQSQASEGVLEPVGYRRYRRHAYRYPYYRPYYRPYAYYQPYAYYRPYPYYYRPYYRPGVSFWFGF